MVMIDEKRITNISFFEIPDSISKKYEFDIILFKIYMIKLSLFYNLGSFILSKT